VAAALAAAVPAEVGKLNLKFQVGEKNRSLLCEYRGNGFFCFIGCGGFQTAICKMRMEFASPIKKADSSIEQRFAA
jgi:hypothetical protein